MVSRLICWHAIAVLSVAVGCSDSETDSGLTDCGNGLVEGIEECDDGNDIYRDGCGGCSVDDGFNCTGGDGSSPSVCEPVCGDSLKTHPEKCDPTVTPGYCSADCTEVIGSCGDDEVQAEAETCDPGSEGVRGCSDDCAAEFGFDCDPDANSCVATGLPEDKLFTDLSAEEQAVYCEWLVDLLGGPGTRIDCEEGSYVVKTAGSCLRSINWSQAGACTVADVEQSVSSKQSLCRLLKYQNSTPACAG